MNYISLTESRGGVPLYQLKITLKWTKPPIWRRVVARSDMRLDWLHVLIQIVMGWTNSHLHQFIVGRTFFGVPDPEIPEFGPQTLAEAQYTLRELAPGAKKKFLYEYDFGDSWMHEIVVEKILPPDPKFKYPVCLAGAKACPPEDCGALPGYYDLLEALADPKHPEHEELSEWIGGEWDPDFFPLAEINRALKQIQPRVRRKKN